MIRPVTRRSLDREEARLWAMVAGTVTRLVPPRHGEGDHPQDGGGAQAEAAPTKRQDKPRVPLHPAAARRGPAPRSGAEPQRPPATIDAHGLDATWERKLAKALVHPDFTLDLHGHSLDAAHNRLDSGLAQASAMGARLVLVITGRSRPVEAADRGHSRGAIRAKVIDWLALGPHGARIAAVRPAHRRHGGAGALYVVLRRPK